MKIIKTIGLALALLAAPLQAAESGWDRSAPVVDKPVDMTVYRSPACGCCGKWLEHMKKNGFAAKDVLTEDMDTLKRQQGVPKELQSCHTALVGGYVVEGHVPAADVAELLKKKPRAVGLTVPGMTTGTPGMEMGGRKDPFAVLEFDKTGGTRVFHDYPSY
ncbi:DUF411 domain-containing protein [Methylomagnum sp.]